MTIDQENLIALICGVCISISFFILSDLTNELSAIEIIVIISALLISAYSTIKFWKEIRKDTSSSFYLLINSMFLVGPTFFLPIFITGLFTDINLVITNPFQTIIGYFPKIIKNLGATIPIFISFTWISTQLKKHSCMVLYKSNNYCYIPYITDPLINFNFLTIYDIRFK